MALFGKNEKGNLFAVICVYIDERKMRLKGESK